MQQRQYIMCLHKFPCNNPTIPSYTCNNTDNFNYIKTFYSILYYLISNLKKKQDFSATKSINSKIMNCRMQTFSCRHYCHFQVLSTNQVQI